MGRSDTYRKNMSNDGLILEKMILMIGFLVNI